MNDMVKQEWYIKGHYEVGVITGRLLRLRLPLHLPVTAEVKVPGRQDQHEKIFS
jgi:hypothetical protein